MKSDSISGKQCLRVSALLGAMVTLCAPRVGSAALLLEYPGTGISISDNAAGDSDPAIGVINNTSMIAGVGVSINVAGSNAPGAPSGAQLQISDLTLRNTAAGVANLTIRVSDTGYLIPNSIPMELRSSTGGTFTDAAIGNSVSFQSFADPLNRQPAFGAGSFSTAPLVFAFSGAPNPGPFSGSNVTLWFSNLNPFSLTNETTLSLSPGATMNFSGTTLATKVPEPLSAGVAGLALAGLALRRGRR